VTTVVVVDSSVALKWFVPEALSDRAASLLDGDLQLAAPDLLYTEAANVLWKKVGRGELQKEEARDVLSALARTPLAITASHALLEAALEIALAHDRTVYDSLYVALAVAHDSVLVTADARLVNALSKGPLSAHVRALSTYGAAY